MKRVFNLIIFFAAFQITTGAAVAQWAEGHSPYQLRKVTVEEHKATNIGSIGLSVTNYGTFGDGWVVESPVDFPSCEYPLGSGIEHIFDGGLWVGGRTPDGDVKVTTAALDVPSISTRVSAGFEFTNTDDPDDRIIERSTIINSAFFSRDAVSHQDFVADFTDTNTFVPETGDIIAGHDPLEIAVHLETYAWNFPFADAFVIFNYKIRNVRADGGTITDLHFGIWADLVIRNTTITSPRIGGPFYQHVGNGYTDSLQMAYAFDYNGDPGFTDEGLYVALKLLGATPAEDDTVYQLKTRYNSWLFRNATAPLLFSPTTDEERYKKMTVDSTTMADVLRAVTSGPGNYMTLISTGPFQHLKADEDRNRNGLLDDGEDTNANGVLDDNAINVVFAVVCAAKAGSDPRIRDTEASKEHLYTNADWAKRAYNGEDKNENNVLDPGEDIVNPGVLDRYLLPTPPLPPDVKVIAGDGMATIYWNDKSEYSRDLMSGNLDFEGYRIYRTQIASDLPGSSILSSFSLISQIDKVDSVGYDTGLDVARLETPVTFEGDTTTYFYKLEERNLNNGWQYAYAITAYDSGDSKNNLPPLESGKQITTVRVFPGSGAAAAGSGREVGVYPNPYRTNAMWDGNLERERKLYFFNLPASCEVRIYTMAGDLVDRFEHNADSYRGEDAGWFEQFSDENPKFAGGEHAWDLVTEDDQAIASGLYIYVVKNLDNGDLQRGKILVIK